MLADMARLDSLNSLRTVFLLIAALLTLLLLPSGLAAQQAAETPAGTRVRLLIDGQQVAGRLGASTRDSLLLLLPPDGRRHAYAVAEVRRLEAYAGRRAHKLQGAATVGLIGSFAGAVLGVAAVEDCGKSQSCTATSALSGALVVGTIGAVVGTIRGAFKSDVWRTVPPPWRVTPDDSASSLR